MQLKRQGFIMVLTVTVASLLLVMAASMVQMCGSHLGLDRYAEDLAAAQQAADAALLESVYQVSENNGWNSGTSLNLARSGANATVSFSGASSVNNAAGNGPVAAADGRSIPAGTVYLRARGTRGVATATSYVLVDPGRTLLDSPFTTNAAGWLHARGLLPTTLLGNLVVGVNLPLTPQEQWEFAGDPAWDGDYTCTVNATITSGVGMGVFMLADATTNTNAYLFQYELLTDVLRGGSFTVRKVTNGVIGPALVQVARSDTGQAGLVSWLLGLQKSWVIKVHDSKFEFRIDGTTVLTYEDTSRFRTAGMIGIYGALNTIALVDEVRVASNFKMKARW